MQQALQSPRSCTGCPCIGSPRIKQTLLGLPLPIKFKCIFKSLICGPRFRIKSSSPVD